jgi:hypothetical protein
MSCRYLFVNSVVDENGEWQVSYHCDAEDTAKIALASGEDSIEYKMWLGDNVINYDRGCPEHCGMYSEEE